MRRPIVLLILDGWGIAEHSEGNAVTRAKTPNYDRLLSTYPHTKLEASGEAVGLPSGEVGNTETGHLNIGAGQIVYQDLPRINMSIADGSFYQNKTFLSAIAHVNKHSSKLHLMGLIGAGGVHANNEHLFALLYLCKDQGLKNVYIHLFTDGRDSPPTSGIQYVTRVNEEIKKLGFGKIASVTGRYYAMDRDQRWDRTLSTYKMLTQGVGDRFSSAEEAIQASYKRGVTDEFIKPTLIGTSDADTAMVQDNDAVIFYNFRIDRSRQLTKAFVLPDLDEVVKQSVKKGMSFGKRVISSLPISRRRSKAKREVVRKNLLFVTMTEYQKNLPVQVAYPKEKVNKPLGRVLSDYGARQLRIAETEKERFVSFYFNGQREKPYIGEDRIFIPSLKVATYDKAPQMRTREIANTIVGKLNENIYDCIVANIAAPDMIAHTGVLDAAIETCEIVDESIGKAEEAVNRAGGVLLITADHGNVEGMLNLKTKEVDTEHSCSPVPFIAVGKEFVGKPITLKEGKLSDVAPTLLAIMQIPQPIEMSGSNLLSADV